MSLISKFLKLEYVVQSLIKENNVACPHCNSKKTTVIGKKYYITQIIECNDCLLCFMNPIYKKSVFGNLYDKLYKAEGLTTSFPSELELDRFKSNNFSNTDKDFSLAINFIKELRHREEGNKEISLLELGSSWGYFLFQASKNEINATGVEISDYRRSYGVEKLNVNICASIDDIRGEVYDVIFTNHVLEHFTDLSTIFNSLSNALKDKGHLVIAVPHYNYYEKDNIDNIVGQVHPLV